MRAHLCTVDTSMVVAASASTTPKNCHDDSPAMKTATGVPAVLKPRAGFLHCGACAGSRAAALSIYVRLTAIVKPAAFPVTGFTCIEVSRQHMCGLVTRKMIPDLRDPGLLHGAYLIGQGFVRYQSGQPTVFSGNIS